MPDTPERRWEEVAIPAMSMAETLVWELDQARYRALPAHLASGVAKAIRVTRQDAADYRAAGMPAADRVATELARQGSVTAVRVTTMRDGSVAHSVERIHDEGYTYHAWACEKWQPRLGPQPRPATQF